MLSRHDFAFHTEAMCRWDAWWDLRCLELQIENSLLILAMLLLHVVADQHRRDRTRLFEVSILIAWFVRRVQSPLSSGRARATKRLATISRSRGKSSDVYWNVHVLGSRVGRNLGCRRKSLVSTQRWHAGRYFFAVRFPGLWFMMNQNESNWIRDFSRWFTESSHLLQASSSRDLSGQRPFAFPNLGASEASTQDLDSLGKFGLFRFSCLEICCDMLWCVAISTQDIQADVFRRWEWFWIILVL